MLDDMRVDNVTDNVQYRDKSETLANLEFPPGLTSPDFDDTYALSRQSMRSTENRQQPVDQRPAALQQTESSFVAQEEETSAVLTQIADGNPALALDAGFEQVWLQTGTALGRLGAEIVNEQRDAGIYSIAMSEAGQSEQQSSNFLRRLMQSVSRGGDESSKTIYRIIVGDVDEKKTLLLVSDDQGKPLDKAQARQVLERLQAVL